MRTILSNQLIKPALSQQWGITAVRFTWPHDTQTTENAWRQIVQSREVLDALISTLPNTIYFVSALTATSTGKQVFPAVGYWIVSAAVTSDTKTFMENLYANSVGAKPSLLLQPFQTSET